jgi:flagellar protein FliO/FliZ
MAQDQQLIAGPSLLGSMLQMFAALAVVVGLILIFYYVSNKWLKSGMSVGGAQRYIRLIETRFLAPKKSLFLIEVGGEYLLLGSSAEGLQLIKQVDMLEEIEVMDGQGLGKLMPATIQNKIIDLVARLPKRSVASGKRLRANGGTSS